ncbi:MAG: SRPBCC domain-containing protein [Cyclobacteriaceae bacterium]
MELKTKILAEDGRQELIITRDFNLPLSLLFMAYEKPEYVEQWMGTKVLKLENRAHGSYRFETTDPLGNKHDFHGAIHEFVPNQKITRTFEMAGFPAQLEFLEFTSVSTKKSKLSMHVLYRSVNIRDQILQLPFAQGLNRAHNRLQDVLNLTKTL